MEAVPSGSQKGCCDIDGHPNAMQGSKTADLQSVLSNFSWAKFLQSRTADVVSCLLVIINAALIGVGTEYAAKEPAVDIPISHQCDLASYFIFPSEIILKMSVLGFKHFAPQGLAWNVFDRVVVGLQLFEITAKPLLDFSGDMNMSGFRVLRLLRLVRITRPVHVPPLIEELRIIVTSVA